MAMRQLKATLMSMLVYDIRIIDCQKLADDLRNRFVRTGALQDLELAIGKYQECLDCTPSDYIDRYAILNNLSSSHMAYYYRTGSLEHLDEAIRLTRESLQLKHQRKGVRKSHLEHLSTYYLNRYRLIGELDDLDQALELSQESCSLTREGSPDLPFRLNLLADIYINKYENTGVSNYLEQAVHFSQKALSHTQNDDEDRAYRLIVLAASYQRIYECTRAQKDLEQAIRNFREAFMHEVSELRHRMKAGRTLLNIYIDMENWPLAYETASLMISLIPVYFPRFLEQSDRQHLLTRYIGLASDATAIALRTGRTSYEVLKMLENGRGIMATALMDMRVDTFTLEQTHPRLAKKFNGFRTMLDVPRDLRGEQQRYSIAKQFEKSIKKIRRMPNFEKFLFGANENDLKIAARRGSTVVINVSRCGCHALIIETAGVRTLELPLLKYEDIRVRTIDSMVISPDIEMLQWLWNTLACPILEALGHTTTPKETWHRVWWVPTGPLAKFPIHAAGMYSETCDTVMDRVISSYSSSIRALIQSQQILSSDTNVRQNGPMVLVGMEKTPGYSFLRFATKEVESLVSLGTSMQLQVKQPSPTRGEVLSALSSCKIFHFAGHGFTDHLNPSQSALVLDDGLLTVEDLFETNLSTSKPFLAYLSACGTGQVKHDKLIDEGLHLIGACQLAGFQHVIGTLWEVNDESCVDIARKTYEWMKKHDMSDQSVSEGLHHASREVRRQWAAENNSRRAHRRSIQLKRRADTSLIQDQPGSTPVEAVNLRDAELVEDLPMHWVPYVHFGI